MQLFITFFLLLFLLTGCSRTTAFTYFEMDSDRERTISNLRTATIVHEHETKAIVSTIYLNNALPETFQGDAEYFIAAIYQNDIGIKPSKAKLNGSTPTDIKVLEEGDRMRALMPIQNEWNNYYLISYPVENNQTLQLTFESDQFGSVVLTYRKDEQ